MTQIELDSIRRRAHTDAVMQFRHNYPAACPFSNVEYATVWRKEVDRVMAELKAAQE